MICDNCGAIIPEKEEFCPNCGMQLVDLYSKPKNKKKYSKNSKSSKNYDFDSFDKPIKQKYMGNSKPESYDYSQYLDDDGYKEHEFNDNYEAKNKRKSGTGIWNIIILLLIALVLGFIVGLLMFTSQLIPQMPGINT